MTSLSKPNNPKILREHALMLLSAFFIGSGLGYGVCVLVAMAVKAILE